MGNEEAGLSAGPIGAANQSSVSTSYTATVGAFTYLWQECPDHEWMGVSILGSWCVGDGYELPGHWVAP